MDIYRYDLSLHSESIYVQDMFMLEMHLTLKDFVCKLKNNFELAVTLLGDAASQSSSLLLTY